MAMTRTSGFKRRQDREADVLSSRFEAVLPTSKASKSEPIALLVWQVKGVPLNYLLVCEKSWQKSADYP
jgi:hypothetical protein